MLIEDLIDEERYGEVMSVIDKCLEMMGLNRPNHFLLVTLNKLIISYYLYMAIDEARKTKNHKVLQILKDNKLIN
jgi:hypothetical protein